MIRYNTDGYVPFMLFFVGLSRQLAYAVAQRLDGIHIKNRLHILHNGSQTFQSHASIYVLLGQIRIVSVSVVVKLGKYIVPYFNIAVAFAAYGTAGLSATVLLAAVIVNLGAGAAGA